MSNLYVSPEKLAYVYQKLKSENIGQFANEEKNAEIFNDYANNVASGQYSHAEGQDTEASGTGSHSEGIRANAAAGSAHAEGTETTAEGWAAHAEGQNTLAKGYYSHAEGHTTQALGQYSHAEGFDNTSVGQASHTEGEGNYTNGIKNHAEGYKIITSKDTNHGEGKSFLSYDDIKDEIANLGYEALDAFIDDKENEWIENWRNISYSIFGNDLDMINALLIHYKKEPLTALPDWWETADTTTKNEYIISTLQVNDLYRPSIVTGIASHIEGSRHFTSGEDLHTEGTENVNTAPYSAHAEGNKNLVSGGAAHAEGYWNDVTGKYAHGEGAYNKVSNDAAHVEGWYNTASGKYSHAEGLNTVANKEGAHAEGKNTTADGANAHAEGERTFASNSSHAEGRATNATGYVSHAEGNGTTASGESSHAEGYKTTAEGIYAHAEGTNTKAIAEATHTEGGATKATQKYAHAEGYGTKATNYNSHAEGKFTIASGDSSHVQGKYNIEDTNNQYAHIVGNGNETARSNAHTLDWNGNAWFAGGITIANSNNGNVYTKTEVNQLISNSGGGGEGTDKILIIDDNYEFTESVISDKLVFIDTTTVESNTIETLTFNNCIIEKSTGYTITWDITTTFNTCVINGLGLSYGVYEKSMTYNNCTINNSSYAIKGYCINTFNNCVLNNCGLDDSSVTARLNVTGRTIFNNCRGYIGNSYSWIPEVSVTGTGNSLLLNNCYFPPYDVNGSYFDHDATFSGNVTTVGCSGNIRLSGNYKPTSLETIQEFNFFDNVVFFD